MGVRLADIHLSQTLRKTGALCTGTVMKDDGSGMVWNEAVKRILQKHNTRIQSHHSKVQRKMGGRWNALIYNESLNTRFRVETKISKTFHVQTVERNLVLDC